MTDIKESALEERIHRSLSNVDEDDKDIFANFEDLKEEGNNNNNNNTTSQPASRNSMKFQDNEIEDWDEGVGAKEDAIFDAPEKEEEKTNNNNDNSNTSSSNNNYVKSKIQELTTVKEQIESTKDNPNILNALGTVLESLKKQIESAFDSSKIDAEDHQTLLDRLHSVQQLISSK